VSGLGGGLVERVVESLERYWCPEAPTCLDDCKYNNSGVFIARSA